MLCKSAMVYSESIRAVGRLYPKTCKKDRKRRRTLLSVKILMRVFLQNLTKNAVNSRASVSQAHSQKIGNRRFVKYLAIAQCEIKVAF